MAATTGLPVSSCWVVTEALKGLQNQAAGLAEALGLKFELKEFKTRSIIRKIFRTGDYGLTPPWPDLLITCGRQSVPAALAVRRASKLKTFCVHIQDPMADPAGFDVVIVPAHDDLRAANVFVTQGAPNLVTPKRLAEAAEKFKPLFKDLPRPLIGVLVGGKNRYEGFSPASIHDFSTKLKTAVTSSGGALAVTPSRRTGEENVTSLKRELKSVPLYMWDGLSDNPYFGLLALSDALVVTGDSISMISEACTTGKPVFIYELPKCGKRHKRFCHSLFNSGTARPFEGTLGKWNYPPLEDTRKAAEFVIQCYTARQLRCRDKQGEFLRF